MMAKLYNNSKLKNLRKKLRKNQTPAESLLWSKIRNKQLNDLKFYRQYSVGRYILDFYCPSERLAIELDGGQHNKNEGRVYDEQRTAYLNGCNIKVLRFWNNDINDNLEGVIESIQSEILRLAGSPPPLRKEE